MIWTFPHKTLHENLWPSDLHRTTDPVKLIELFLFSRIIHALF